MISFRPLFSKGVFANAMVLTVGVVLAPGQRTVTAAFHAVGVAGEQAFCVYHRVLLRTRRLARQGSRVLLAKLAEGFAREGPLVLGIDDTIERRWGPEITVRGISRDPVRSSGGHFVKDSGLRWLSMMLLTPIS